MIFALGKLGLHANVLPCILSVPLLAAIILAVCTALYALLRRVPFVNRWLI